MSHDQNSSQTHFVIFFQFLTIKMRWALYQLTSNVCSCLKRTMHKSVIIRLNNFMKVTRHGDIQCISCSLSFSFRGYYLVHSISCSLSFLTKRENY